MAKKVKPRRKSLLVPHPKGKAKTNKKSVAGKVSVAAGALATAPFIPVMTGAMAAAVIAREGVKKVAAARKRKKAAAARKKPAKRKMRPPTIGPAKKKKKKKGRKK